MIPEVAKILENSDLNYSFTRKEDFAQKIKISTVRSAIFHFCQNYSHFLLERNIYYLKL